MEVPGQLESIVKSLKGVQQARVITQAGQVARIVVRCAPAEQKDVLRNIQSALMAVLGVRVEAGVIVFDEVEPVAGNGNGHGHGHEIVPAPVRAEKEARSGVPVLELASVARRADLNEAARAAFDTLRTAQSIFHGFVFDGAELVTIAEGQYIVVAVRRSATDARYCGAAPVVTSVATASARALMNAVGVAAMGGPVELSEAEVALLEKKQA
jgi:hypothetical protein